jgi:hypothetical protein
MIGNILPSQLTPSPPAHRSSPMQRPQPTKANTPNHRATPTRVTSCTNATKKPTAKLIRVSAATQTKQQSRHIAQQQLFLVLQAQQPASFTAKSGQGCVDLSSPADI